MTTSDITARVSAALAELGDTTAAIAEQLRAKGVKGIRGDECSCPIANYLTALDGVATIEVGAKTIWLYDAGGFEVGTVDTPPAVADFISAFDRGAYADLVGMPS